MVGRLKLGLSIIAAMLTFGAIGQNYTALNGPFGGSMTDIVQCGSSLVGAVNGQGIVLSHDNGATWTTSNAGINIFTILDLEYHAASTTLYALTSTKLFASTDNGVNWITVASSGFADGGKVKRNSNYIFIVGRLNGNVYRSADGSAWNLLTTLTNTADVLDFDIADNQNLFISTTEGIFRSVDNGLMFTQLDAGEGLTATGNDIWSLAISGNQLFALGSNGPFKSIDNGSSWNSASNGPTVAHSFAFGKAEAVSNTIVLVSRNTFFRSTDGGTSWEIRTHPQAGNTNINNPTAQLMVSESEIYCSLDGWGSFRSTNGALSWTSVNNGVTGFALSHPNQFLFVPTSNRLLFLRPNADGVFISIDDGANWDLSNSDPLNKRFDGIRRIGSTVYLYGNAGLVRSTDNAVSFSLRWNGQIDGCTWPLSALANFGVSTFYAYSNTDCSIPKSDHYLMRSIDAGQTWTRALITGLPAIGLMTLQKRSVHTDANGSVYLLFFNATLGVAKNQLYKVDPATNSATLVNTIPGTASIVDMVSNNGKIYVVAGDGKIHYSTDGTSWTSLTPGFGTGTLRVIDDNTLYLLRSTGANLSLDGGASWVNTGIFPNSNAANDIVISPGNFAYAAVNANAVHKSVAQIVPPAAPTALSIVSNHYNAVSLKFNDNSNNEEYFIVEMSEGNNSNYDSVGTVSPPSPQTFGFSYVTSLTPSTTYFFRVRAKGAAGKSAYSNEATSVTPASCANPPSIPANRSWTVTTSSGSNPLVNITQGSTAGTYTIDNMYKGTASALALAGTVSLNCNDAVLLQSGSIIPNGNGSWNANTNTLTIPWRTGSSVAVPIIENSVYTLNAIDPVPSAPTGVEGFVRTGSEIVINWSHVAYAQSYQVERAVDAAGPFQAIGSPIPYPSSTFQDNSGLSLGTIYHYRLRAIGSGGTSAPSASTPVAFATPKFESSNPVDMTSNTQGIAWADLDNDGDQDLVVARSEANATPLLVLQNNGNNFVAVAAQGISEVSAPTFRAISVADVNNDGRSDFIATATSVAGANLFLNNTDGSFSHTELVPASPLTTNNMIAGMADFNNDGLLDLVFSSDTPIPAKTDVKFFTQSADGAFSPYEIGELPANVTPSRAACWADVDNDGDLDFLRTSWNIALPDYDLLYKNNAGVFTLAQNAGFENDFAIQPRTVTWGDFDNDLDLDLFVGHAGASLNNMLYLNDGSGTFVKISSSPVTAVKTVATMGSAAGDIDNDGDLDLIVANATRSQIFLNDGAAGFSEYFADEYLTSSSTSRQIVALALADFDNNGSLDVAATNSVTTEPRPMLLHKNLLSIGAATRWLKVKLAGVSNNRDGLGARIIVTTPDGKQQMRQALSQTGYGSSSGSLIHFGLKNQTVADVQVIWPSGIVQTMRAVAANQLLTIPEDNQPPLVAAIFPINNQSIVATTTKVRITFTENTKAVAGKKLRIYNIDNLSTPVRELDVSAASKTGLSNPVFEFTISPKLDIGRQYRIGVEAGAFQDIYENNFAGISTDSWMFSTDPGASPLSLLPTHQSLGVAANTSISITFDRDIVPQENKFLKLYLSPNLVNAVQSLPSTAATVSGATATFSLPAKLTRLTGYFVALDEGAFADASGNNNIAIPTAQWNFTTEGGPMVSEFTPVNASSNVSISTAIELQFNTAIDFGSGSIKILNGATVIVDAVITEGEINGDTYTFTPAVALPYNTLLNIILDPGSLINATTHTDFAGLTSGMWTFTTALSPDVTPPSITFNQNQVPTQLQSNFNEFTIGLTATDDRQVANVVVKHRRSGDKQFEQTQMVYNTTTAKWETMVSNSWLNDMGFEYYFEANDNATPAPNVGRLPTTSNQFFQTVTAFSADPPEIPLPSGGDLNSWKIIAVPLVFEGNDNDVTSVFASLGLPDKAKWRLLTYQHENTWREDIIKVERGRGYFINTRLNGATLNLSSGVAPSETRDKLFSMPLIAGWNQIGNPYTVPVNVNDVKAFNPSLASATFYKFSNGAYVVATTLAPFEGAFVNVTQPSTISIPFQGQTTSGGRDLVATLSSDLQRDSWTLPIRLTQDGREFNIAAIGMAPDASASLDEYDQVTPPRFMDVLELSFAHPEHVSKTFSVDIVPTQQRHIWTFEVASSLKGTATLRWNNEAVVTSPNEMYLIDEARQLLINMKDTGLLEFNPIESSRFKIYYGNVRGIIPEDTQIAAIFPNPASGTASVAFSLSDQEGTNQHVKLEFIDISGRVVATLVDSDFLPGYHRIQFDLHSVIPGFYTYRISVHGRGVRTSINKIVIK